MVALGSGEYWLCGENMGICAQCQLLYNNTIYRDYPAVQKFTVGQTTSAG
jgi:hypothetical protein